MAEMEPRATKSLLQNISNDSLTLHGLHSVENKGSNALINERNNNKRKRETIVTKETRTEKGNSSVVHHNVTWLGCVIRRPREEHRGRNPKSRSWTMYNVVLLYLSRDRVTAGVAAAGVDRLPQPVGDRNRTRPFPVAEDQTHRPVTRIRETGPPDPSGCRNSGVCHPAAAGPTTIRCAAVSASGAVRRKCWRRQSLQIISDNPIVGEKKKREKREKIENMSIPRWCLGLEKRQRKTMSKRAGQSNKRAGDTIKIDWKTTPLQTTHETRVL